MGLATFIREPGPQKGKWGHWGESWESAEDDDVDAAWESAADDDVFLPPPPPPPGGGGGGQTKKRTLNPKTLNPKPTVSFQEPGGPDTSATHAQASASNPEVGPLN